MLEEKQKISLTSLNLLTSTPFCSKRVVQQKKFYKLLQESKKITFLVMYFPSLKSFKLLSST